MQLLPQISPFLELTERAVRSPNKIILRDHSSGVTATAGQLLHSVSLLRAKLQSSILQYSGNDSEDRFIFLLAPPGWEYVVSMLAIFSLGAAHSPQSVVIRPEEMIRFFKLAKPIALLYASSFTEKVDAIRALCAEAGNDVPQIPIVQIETSYPETITLRDYKIETTSEPIPTRTGSLFFTSGTSGNQKGVVHTYQALLASARERIQTWKLTEDDVVLNQKPGNWMGGIFGIIPTLMSGACLEVCVGVFNEKWFWERVSKGDVSIFDIAATGYDRLAIYFDEHIAGLPPAEKERYIHGMTAVRVAGVSGSLLPPFTQARWTELRRGKPLLNLYGSTEMTLICSMGWENPVYEDMCCIGPPVPGVEAKIVDGEMRLKAPTMFSRYISTDPTVTEKAFDSDGFFKTGDCASKVGDCYTLHGRASIDVLHFWGFTLHTMEIETALHTLPYISAAVVLPVDDDEYKERAAAILKLKPGFTQPDFDTLRQDLTDQTGLFLFKQPTVLYWLKEGEDIPISLNGKISKVDAKKKFFGDGWKEKEDLLVLSLKGMDYWRIGGLV
ncbi:hypothetical protein BGZ60DRAFT_570534 [Tricladium varicosporioides]|nr:hypothetical protein BGZ60DRAFT_570534 [Hymenoscyphus varicosporioides]